MTDDELRDHWSGLRDIPVPASVVAETKRHARLTVQRRNVRTAWLGLAAAVALTLAVAVVAVRMPTATPATSASPPASVGPSPGTPAPSALAIGPGVVAEVRTSFALVADRRVEVGQKVYVVDGPVDRDGTPSYLIQHWGDLDKGIRPDSDFGWMGAADAQAWLVPVRPDCPAGEVGLRDVARLQIFERPLCFGQRELTFGPVTATDYAVGAKTSRRWISDDGQPDFFTGLPIYVNDVALQIPDGAWVEVTGRFDDPSSAGCGDAAAVTFCRQKFVVTAVSEVQPPGFVLRGEWRTLAQPPIGGRQGHTMVWTGREVLVWGGVESSEEVSSWDGVTPANGAAYNPATDRWRLIPEAPIAGRLDPVSVWTGSELLVWGGWAFDGTGAGGGSWRADGAAYDPAGDIWRPLPAAPVAGPGTAGGSGTVVGGWVAGRFVVLTDGDAAAYDPAADRWEELPPAPVLAAWRSVVVAEDRLFVVAFGDGATDTPEAAVLNLGTRTWTPTRVPLAPLDAGVQPFAAAEVVVFPARGQRFDPRAGTWDAIVRCERAGNGSAWTGRYLIGPSGAWDAETDECLDIPPAPPRGAPFEGTNGREFPVGVWTGEEYITWSGGTGGDIVFVPNDGAAFRPDAPGD